MSQMRCLADDDVGQAVFLICEVEWVRGAWYGNIAPFRGQWAACVIYLSERIAASDQGDVIRRFDWLTRVRFAFEPCTVQASDDAFAVCPTRPEALEALKEMARRFDVDRRAPDEDSPYAANPLEMRVFELYGFRAHERRMPVI